MQFKIRNRSSLYLHPDYRWDGEYLSVEPYKNMLLEYVPLGNAILSTQYGKSIKMFEDGVGTKIYRMNEISNVICDRHISKYAELDADEIELYRLKDKDVLFNRTNSQPFVGRTGLYRKFSNEDIVFASYLVRITPNPDVVTPEYLTAFLNTKYGILDVKRRARISINQSNVNPEELKRIEIPLICNDMQKKIARSFNDAYQLIQASEAKYIQANRLLLAELGLLDWDPKHSLSFVRNYSDTYCAERIDADFFQPKFAVIEDSIRNYSGGWDVLENLVTVKKCIEVGSDKYLTSGIPFVRVSNLSPFGITEEKYISEDTYAVVQQHQPCQGEILLSKDATPGIAHYLKDHPRHMIPSGGILRLKIKTDKVNDEYLTSVLNSVLVQEQAFRDVGGSVILHWRPDQVKRTMIPILSADKQTQIQNTMQESRRIRERSDHLLKCAIRAVELAIEKNEQCATEWLESKAGDERDNC